MKPKNSLKRDLKTRYTAAADLLNVVLPPCREKSIAMTELEASQMWAEKAIDRIGDDDART